jgi:Tfp pilus assembly protein PilF
MPSLAPTLFAEALAHYQSGRLPEAEQLCRKVLAAHPRNADSLHLIGLIARKAGHNDMGADLFRKAISLPTSYSRKNREFRLRLAIR